MRKYIITLSRLLRNNDYVYMYSVFLNKCLTYLVVAVVVFSAVAKVVVVVVVVVVGGGVIAVVLFLPWHIDRCLVDAAGNLLKSSSSHCLAPDLFDVGEKRAPRSVPFCRGGPADPPRTIGMGPPVSTPGGWTTVLR